MIKCKICFAELHYINNTHLKKHSLSISEYQIKFDKEIKSTEYKKIAYKTHSQMMSNLWESGVIVPRSLPLEERKLISERMKRNNPMKNPLIARMVGLARRGIKTKPRTEQQRLNMRISKLGPLNPRWTGGVPTPNYRMWDKSRRLALQRDKYMCVRCGVSNEEHSKRYKKGLHVHHINPYKRSENNSLDNLITLCVQCHLKEEAISIKNPL